MPNPNVKPGKPGKGGKGSKMPPMPKGDSFWVNLATSVALLLLLAGAYAYFETSNKPAPAAISISQVAQDIEADKVSGISVNGDDLNVLYNDASSTQKVSKKEPETALTQTLFNYGVTGAELNKVTITIASQSGWEFWLQMLAPFASALLLIAFFVWYLSRQVRGAGMQAFSFGQSKPRLIDPNDANSRVTFKDVAGAKEAKEELLGNCRLLKKSQKVFGHRRAHPQRHFAHGRAGHRQNIARARSGRRGRRAVF